MARNSIAPSAAAGSNSSTIYGQRSALPLPSSGVTIGNLDQEPDCAEQYLMRVMAEAASAPPVVVADNRDQLIADAMQATRAAGTDHCPADQHVQHHSPATALPNDEWVRGFQRRLVQQRAAFNAAISAVAVPEDFLLPGSTSAHEWKPFCYSSGSQGSSGDACSKKDIIHAMAAIDQATAMRLIKWMTAWLSSDKLRPAEAIWLWYLILKLDELLDYEDTHTLRELCRKLKAIRATVALLESPGASVEQSQSQSQSQSQAYSDQIAALNILILAVTRGYNQQDLE
ncbi:hypothetical protein GGI07_004735 [Coemansia sp. Benny D115]|nr:hypothetical protein GGI07_004735 [Coemansia sp. Benny D115]